MIEGVESKDLKLVQDERGWLMELMRSDWNVFEEFGQVYITTAYPNVVKAWHMHKKQTDFIACVRGQIKLALYDGRKNSETTGEVEDLVIGERNPKLVKVPPEVWHGFKAVGGEMAAVVNVPTELYDYEDPDEERLPPDTDEIDYDWNMAEWLEHG
ncbi:dTDP-4-dehydrorhamnose 3,5-epimerase [candidate division MSBL1 archaeon SCGC-AAA382A20]|uniref:dTDP-4-dehydrorhamnose 3,5-epimerase n=1 Tax=candidate division MSBL1 archaeon SCGC-AAA382A20 TaxID=1698280 RepID=A0A133VHP1_9EURY|nr:dTDP-4-dehydrorhamnose 3,5-epimerase [candidate division MSBL1 archaeon SCGC-AAA382A20]